MKLSVCVAAIAMSVATAVCSAITYTNYELQMLQLVNDWRADAQNNGVGYRAPLQLDPRLTFLARRYSTYMKVNDHWGHDSQNGTPFYDRVSGHDFNWTYTGENIAARSDPLSSSSVYAMFLQWKNSPPHNANMLNENFEKIGIGFYDGPGQGYTMYGTQDFGTLVSDIYGFDDDVIITNLTGGDSLVAGSTVTVCWDADPDLSHFDFRYSLNGGIDWILADSYINATNYDWSVPETTTTELLIWVGASDDQFNYHFRFDTTFTNYDDEQANFIWIVHPGDVDANGTVDGLDLTAVITAWNSQPGEAGWNSHADLDNNDLIDGLDLTAVISNWSSAASVPEPATVAFLLLLLLPVAISRLRRV